MTTTTEPPAAPVGRRRGRGALTRFGVNTLLALATGYLLFFFSERLF